MWTGHIEDLINTTWEEERPKRWGSRDTQGGVYEVAENMGRSKEEGWWEQGEEFLEDGTKAGSGADTCSWKDIQFWAGESVDCEMGLESCELRIRSDKG